MQRDGEVAAGVIGCVGLFPVVILGYLLRGWALVKLWTWFLTPVFHVAAPNPATAIGLAILGSMLVSNGSIDKTDKSSDESVMSKMLSAYARILLAAPLAVGIAWIVKQWA